VKTPYLANQAFLADVANADRSEHCLHLWWLGQSGFLVQWQGRHLLFDPYLSDSLTRKYADTDKPHVRMTERVIDPADLDFVDVVTSTHNHTDHLDAETLLPLRRVNPALEIVVPAANQAFVAERLQLPPERLLPMDAGESVTVGPFTLHAVPAAHEQLKYDEQGRCRFLGYVAQFGEFHVYHSGDTVRYAGMAERLRAWPIDVALLPINGRAAERRVSGNLFGNEAAELAADIHARYVIPCHFDMFEFNTASPTEFVRCCESLGQSYHVLQNGERLTILASS
jgi:L-ascorbate metabolism protein UlaG (beta-lactamase superfamily)